MITTPNPALTKTPATAPLGALLAGAAVAAVQAIIPIASGQQPNYALLAATFLVTFGATFAAALYHLQLPNGLEQATISEITALMMPAISQHSHTVVTASPSLSAQTVTFSPSPLHQAAGLAPAPEPPVPSPSPVPAAPLDVTPPAT